MSPPAYRWISLAATAVITSTLSLSACTVDDGGPGEPDSEELTGAPEEDLGQSAEAITGSVAVGSTLTSTADVNLRVGPSTSYEILRVVARGSKVTMVQSSPRDGFYEVEHNGTTGWSYGLYYQAGSTGGATSNAKRDAAIERARSSVGFSYWWGHARFRPEGPTSSNKGSCSGDCPSCSHEGSYGGDCSGLAGKVWQVPSSNSDLTVDSHPYSTVSFNKDSRRWSTVSRSSMKKADAMVYNSDGAGHIFIHASGDGWGSMYAYECKGCSYGCVYNLRTASSAYHGIRRAGY